MSSPLADRSGLAIAPPSLVDSPVENSGSVLDRVMALASLARQKDPSLPQNLRAYRRVPSGSLPSEIPFRLVFTSDHRSRLPNGVVEDAALVDFWEALDRTVPGLAKAEQQRLAIRVAQKGMPALDAAMEEGYRRGDLSIVPHRRSAGDAEHFYTSALAVKEDTFLAYPDLGNVAFQAQGQPDTRSAIGRLIGRYQAVCQTLSQPLEQSSAVTRQTLVANIKALNKTQADDEGSFEENHRHGWIAYAMAAGGKDWTSFLLRQKDGTEPLVSPYAPYGKLSPLVMAVGTNDRLATRELLDAGVSPNTVLREMPQMFEGRAQTSLNKLAASDFLPVLVFASATGSAGAVAALLDGGAEVNFADENGNTALHMACAQGTEAVARVLDLHRASFTVTNANGHAPDEMIPQGDVMDNLHKWALARYEAQSGPSSKAPSTLGQRVQAAGLVKDDPESLWTQASARPAPVRRSKNTP